MATSYNLADWIWIPDEVEIVIPGKVLIPFNAGQPGRVEIMAYNPSSKVHEVVEERSLSPKQTKKLERMDPNSQHSIDNMVNLRALSEASILHNLRMRHVENNIYTSVGSILISVNPFRELPLYTAEKLEAYKDNGYRNMAPHVYGIADMAYTSMNGSGRNQSCIVSGESGAGKTEATKIFLQYIAEVSSQAAKQDKTKNKDSSYKVSLQEQILRANPLMEAFGNAKTVRNDNSSRFGKWIEIRFNNKKGTIIGGKINQYLLEKSRIVKQSNQERNYHIFYNLCAGAGMDSSVRQKFNLTEARDYKYLVKSADIMNIPGMSDEASFEDVLNSMQLLGINFVEQDNILMIVAGILHLGNINFIEKPGTHAEDSQISNPAVLEIAATQLGVKSKLLEAALTTKKIKIAREETTKDLSVSAALDTRDALSKALYANLFEWLIKRINLSFSLNEEEGSKTSHEDTSIIGVLDIFGFEVFEWNSLEQLCINYCNEKLQLHFNNHIFKLEAELYKNEGIDVSKIEFNDNIPTIQLFEKKGVGIYTQMDEQMFMPHGTESKFLDKICQLHKGHPNFRGKGLKTNYERASFTIIHYAGAVMYNVIGFLEKNSDKLSEDLSDLINLSDNEFISNLLASPTVRETDIKKTRGNTRRKGASLCTKFKNQLNVLMKTLEETEPQFIRCIKPNQEKVGGIFTSQLVLEQLRYAGILEVCRIRKLGYPIRREFKHFLYRYSCLVDENVPRPRDAIGLCNILTKQKLMIPEEFQVGKSKIFMRGAQVDVLEGRRVHALKKYAVVLQRVTRGWIERKKYLGYKVLIQNLKAAIASRVVLKINQAIEDYGELPFAGLHRVELREARQLLQQLEENNRVLALLVAATQQRTLEVIESALSAAAHLKIVPNFREQEFQSEIKRCEEIKEEIIAEENAKKNMLNAIQSRNLQGIRNALTVLNELELQDTNEYQQGEVLRAKLEEAELVLQNIDRAVVEGDLEDLRDALNAAEEIGGFEMDERFLRGKAKKAEIIAALEEEKRLEELAAEERRAEELRRKQEKQRQEIKAQLEAAVKSKDVSLLYDLRAKAVESGLQGEEVDQLLARVEQMETVNRQVEALQAAMHGLRTLMLNKNGIATEDTLHLINVIDKSREVGLTEDNEVMKEAVALESKANAQLDVQAALGEAMYTSNIPNLQVAIANADEQNLDLDLLFNAREMLKDTRLNKPDEFKSLRASAKFFQVPEEDEHLAAEEREREAARRREEMIQEARHPKFHFSKFYNIRSPSDYVRGMLFNKRKYIEKQLVYQTNPIPKSILALKKEHNKAAVSVYKSILGYCGEISMQFPASLAQDILEKGVVIQELVDEIYIQLCKHMTDNDQPESVNRTWQLMCMAVGTFPPSAEFEFYLINFLVENSDIKGIIGNYARYSLRRLEGMLIRGASGFVPTLDVILAYKQRPPVLSTIETVDGTPITEDFPVPPDLNVERVIDICSHFMELDDPRMDLFGIYVQEEPEHDGIDNVLPESGYSAMRRNDINNVDAPPPPPIDDEPAPLFETPHPLRGSDFLGDVVIQTSRKKSSYTLVFKKKLFLPKEDEESTNARYNRMIYLQAADEVIRGNVLVEDLNSFLYLTGIAIQLDLEPGKLFPVREQQLLELDVMSYIPFNWMNKKTDKQWARAILPKRGKINILARKDVQGALLEQEYVRIVSELPLWGFNFFFVRETRNGKDIICGVRYEGLTFFTPARKKMRSYAFHHIERWGGSSTQFWCLVWNQEQMANTKVSFYTKQARDISNLILDYTRLRQIHAQQVK